MKNILSKQLMFQAEKTNGKTITAPSVVYADNGNVFFIDDVLIDGNSLPSVTSANNCNQINPDTLKTSFNGGVSWISINSIIECDNPAICNTTGKCVSCGLKL